MPKLNQAKVTKITENHDECLTHKALGLSELTMESSSPEQTPGDCLEKGW